LKPLTRAKKIEEEGESVSVLKIFIQKFSIGLFIKTSCGEYLRKKKKREKLRPG
jgi:hypothetical protein